MALPWIVPGLGERSLGSDLLLSLVSPSRLAELGGPDLLPTAGCFRERGPGAVGASRSLSRAGAGAEPNCRWGPPPGEGLRANAAGRLPRSPSRPSGRLCRRAPQQRRLPCAVGVSASLGEWGPLRPGPGMRGGQPRSQDPTSRAPQPAPPRSSWDSSHPWRCQPGAAPGDRATLSRVLTAEWPAPGSRAQSVPGAPSRRDLAPSAGRMEAGAQGRSRGRFRGDARAGF